ncbi:MAG: ParA family protein [Gammaproteobacteria bacterium]|nr:MAG: ParA family protein [Gammaproteobacteria bacterium]
MRILATMNQKGGVGKTTTTVSLCHALALAGHKVLGIDLDPQGHLASSFGHQEPDLGLDALFRDKATLDEVIVNTRDNLDLIAPGPRLNEFDGLMGSSQANGWLLHNELAELQGYDYVVIDCPPSSGLLGMNGLMAADEVLIPVPGDYLALLGLSRLLNLLEELEEKVGKHTEKWILVTRFDSRRRHAHEVVNKIHHYFPDQLLPVVIHECVVLAESPSFSKSIFEYQPNSRAAKEYQALADNLVSKTTVTRMLA